MVYPTVCKQGSEVDPIDSSFYGCGHFTAEKLLKLFKSKSLDMKPAFGDKPVLPESLSWEQSCWVFEDDEGRQHGPHSLAELSNWHSSSYLHDLSRIYHVDGKFGPFSFASLINGWSGGSAQSSEAVLDDSELLKASRGALIDETSHQLHAVIMEPTRRPLIDVIFNGVIPEFIAARSTERQLSVKSKSYTAKPHAVSGNKPSLVKDRFAMAFAPLKKADSSYLLGDFSSADVLPTIICDNLADVLSAVWQATYYESMKNICDGVLYDPVMNYCGAWLKRKHQLNLPSTIGSASGSANMQSINQVATKLTGDQNAPQYDLDLPPWFGASREIEADGKPKSSFTLLSGPSVEIQRSLVSELYVAAKEFLFDHFKEVIAVEITNLLCIKLESNVNQERTDFPESVGAPKLISSAEAAADKSPSPVETVAYKVFSPADKTASPTTIPAEMVTDRALTIKYGTSNSTNSTPAISKYTTSICGQNLHDDTVRECLLSDSPNSCFDSWYSRQNVVPTATGNSLTRIKHTYYRKRKFKKSDGASSLKQPMDISMDKQHYKSVCKIVESKVPVKNIQELNNTEILESFSIVDKLSRKDATAQDNDAFDLNSQQETRLPRLKSKLVIDKTIPTEVGALSTNSVVDKFSTNEIAFDLNSQQDLKLLPSSDVPKKSRSPQLKRKVVIDKTAPTKVSALSSCPSKKRKHRNMSSGNTKPLILDPKSDGCATAPTNLSASPLKKRKGRNMSSRKTKTLICPKDGCSDSTNLSTSPLKKRKRRNMSRQKAKPLILSSKSDGHSKASTNLPTRPSKKRNRRNMSRRKSKPLILSPKSDGHSRASTNFPTGPLKKRKCRNMSSLKTKHLIMFPKSDGCARASISGWEWHEWAGNATPAEKAHVRGYSAQTANFTLENNKKKNSHIKGPSPRTNRAKSRNLLAAAGGSELVKLTQLKARKKRLCFQRSKIHGWGLVALEPIDAEDFVIEYVGELIRQPISDIREQQYKKHGIRNYFFWLNDDFVVDATKRGGLARLINHSCEPNCYPKLSTLTEKRKYSFMQRGALMWAKSSHITIDYL